jgi:uncharacterized protein
MPTHESIPTGAPCWVDLMTSDPDRARTFYGEVLGWTAEVPNPEFGGYFNFQKDGVLVAGCMSAQAGAGMPDVWSVYLATDDAARTLEAVMAGGGQVLVDAMPVADLGTMAVVADPGGATIGVWQPGLHRGFGVLAEPGAPAWFELYTRDYDKVVPFYREVFGLGTQEMDDAAGRYTLQTHGDSWRAGVADASSMLPDGVPAHWAVYFGVADTDAAVAKVVELGGSVLQPAEDTEHGRIAVVRDPMGAAFRVVAATESMPG